MGSGLTIGVLNEFPESPNYIKQRTLVFRHQKSGYDKGGFKDLLTQSASDFLVSKGYKVLEVDSKNALKEGRADILLEIQPMNIFKQDDTLGYGFYDRKFLQILLKKPATSYICMNLNLYRKNSLSVKRSGRQENFSKLDFPELPESLDELTADQKKSMSLNLEQNIRNAIYRALPLMGF